MSISFDFTGRTVIVTGAARGIGLELGRYFRQAGATTVLVDFDGDELAKAAAEIGAIGMQADVAKTEDVERVVADTVAQTGRVDVVVNNAGILRDKVLWKLTDDDWDAVLAVHAGGTFRFTRAAVPHFREQGFGRVINVTSYTGLRGNTGQANYATAKAGIIGFTKSLAREVASRNITVNAVAPGFIDTDMTRALSDDQRASLTGQIPAGRLGTPADIAAAVAFLVSPGAAYITGQTLHVNGGMHMA